jgi:hypothetical protein
MPGWLIARSTPCTSARCRMDNAHSMVRATGHRECLRFLVGQQGAARAERLTAITGDPRRWSLRQQ